MQHGQLDWLWQRFITKTLEAWDEVYRRQHDAGKPMHRTRLYGKPAEDVWLRWQLNRGTDYECWPWDWAVNYRNEWCQGKKTEHTAMVTLHMEDNYHTLEDPVLLAHTG